jgi:hypothetical protein
MADPDYSSFLSPDKQLANLWNQLQNREISESQYNKLSSERMRQISEAAGGVSLAIGSGGFVTPNLAYSEESGDEYADLLAAQKAMQAALSGKQALLSTGESGIYSGAYYNDKGQLNYSDPRLGTTSDPAAKGMANYDPNSTNQKFFFDAQGNKLTPSQAAASSTGKNFAAAGWDIGFGPGMIAPGVKADTSEREERIERGSSSRVEQPQEREVPRPTPPSPPPPPPPPPPVKTAPIDTILFDDNSVPIEIMTDLIFENIGGQEIISIVRNDTVNGQNIIYKPIKNLSLINQQYNPNNILALQGTSDKYFENFIIKLLNKQPNEGNGPNGSNLYIDENTLDIVLDLINMEQDEQAEFQFRIDGTIYEAEL